MRDPEESWFARFGPGCASAIADSVTPVFPYAVEADELTAVAIPLSVPRSAVILPHGPARLQQKTC